MQVTVTGRLGKEPNISYFESGAVKTIFTLAVGDYNAETKEKCTSWFNVEVWDKKAEFVAEHCKKGAMVTVTGYLKEEFNENNSKLYYKIVANDVRFDGAYITLNGIVNKVEDRFTSDNKRMQTIYLEGQKNIYVENYTKEQIKEYDNVTLLCTLAMREYKPYIKAFKAIRNDIVDSSKADNQDVTENIVEFGNEELPF